MNTKLCFETKYPEMYNWTTAVVADLVLSRKNACPILGHLSKKKKKKEKLRFEGIIFSIFSTSQFDDNTGFLSHAQQAEKKKEKKKKSEKMARCRPRGEHMLP